MALFIIEDFVREESPVEDSHHDFGQLVSRQFGIGCLDESEQ